MARLNPSPKESAFTGKTTFLDLHSLHEGTNALASEDRVQVDFARLKGILRELRTGDKAKAKGWADAELIVALLSIDTKSEGQQRFADMVARYFEVEESYYRDNFVSTPAGRHPAEVFDKEKGVRPFISLAPRLAYGVGRLARYEEPHVLVLTHCFELYYPLTHLVRSNMQARVGLAYFSSLLDHRWKQAGLFDDESPVDFFDLDPYASEILGGIELTGRRATQSAKRSPFDRI